MSVYDQTVTHNGRTQTINEWAEEIGITPSGLYKRLMYSSMSKDKALSMPNVHSKTYNGKTLRTWEEETGIERHILWHRFNDGKHKDDLSTVLKTPVPKHRQAPYPPLIFGYHREHLHNKAKRCCHPDCFSCPYKDCVMK